MRRAANLPVTGPRAASHSDAETLKRLAQSSLDNVQSAKRQASQRPAGVDTSRENAQRAVRERWSDGSFGRLHRPNQ